MYPSSSSKIIICLVDQLENLEVCWLGARSIHQLLAPCRHTSEPPRILSLSPLSYMLPSRRLQNQERKRVLSRRNCLNIEELLNPDAENENHQRDICSGPCETSSIAETGDKRRLGCGIFRETEPKGVHCIIDLHCLFRGILLILAIHLQVNSSSF